MPHKLKEHNLNVHQGHKDYICDFCGTAYAYAATLRGHINRNHKNSSNDSNTNAQEENNGHKPLTTETEIMDFIQSAIPNEDKI